MSSLQKILRRAICVIDNALISIIDQRCLTPPKRADYALLLSVVIPVHNEAEALGRFLDSLILLLEAALPSKYEIIVINDASTDKSGEVATDAGTNVTLLTQARRKGSGAARKLGSSRASGDIVVWVDGDGTYAPSDVLCLAQFASSDDQVIGARPSDFGRWRRLRLGVKGITRWLAGLLWHTTIPDLNSGLRAFRRDCLLTWLDELPDGFSCTSTATLAALNHRQNVRFLPVSYSARRENSRSKFHPIWDTLRLWRAVGRCWWRRQ